VVKTLQADTTALCLKNNSLWRKRCRKKKKKEIINHQVRKNKCTGAGKVLVGCTGQALATRVQFTSLAVGTCCMEGYVWPGIHNQWKKMSPYRVPHR